MKNSTTPSLGKFVRTRPRDDGTHRVWFELPARLRPSGWSGMIPLPTQGERTGNLNDPAHVAQIRADAGHLFQAYQQARGVVVNAAPLAPLAAERHSIKVLIRTWESSEQYFETKPVTQVGYAHYAKIVQRWALAIGDPDVETIEKPDIERFLKDYRDRPGDRYHLRQVLQVIFRQAVDLKWRWDNPVKQVKVKQPETKLALWTQADVEAHMACAIEQGQPGLAALEWVMWMIGQRLTDLIRFRHGAEYDRGSFSFEQSKTGSSVAIPATKRMRELIEDCRVEGSLYLFNDSTGRPFRNLNRLSHVFDKCRPAGSKLRLMALRHSCATRMADSGCTINEIASITGHSLSSAHTILKRYAQRTTEQASNAMRKQGLI